MKIAVKKSDFFDLVILWGLILQVVIIRWLDLHEPFNLLVDILIIIRMLTNFNFFLKRKSVIAFLIFFSYLFFNWSYLGGTIYIFSKNFYRAFKTLIIIWYFSHLLEYKSDFTVTFFEKNFFFFNIYFLINIPIIIAQLNGYYILLGYRTDYNRKDTIDFVSGLFGLYGMPRLNLFLLFIFFYNLEHIRKQTKTLKWITFKLYNYAFFLFWLAESFATDNKGIYLCLPMYVGVYYLCLNYVRITKNIRSHIRFWNNILFMAVFGIILIVSLISIYDPLREMVELIILTVKQGVTKMNATGGSNERFGMIAFAWTNKNYRWFGAGIGRHATDEAWGFGFAHFGQSDFGVYMLVAGTFFIIVLLYFIWMMNRAMFKGMFISLVMTMAFAILSIYSQQFTDAALTNEFLFFQVVCYAALYKNNRSIKKIE